MFVSDMQCPYWLAPGGSILAVRECYHCPTLAVHSSFLFLTQPIRTIANERERAGRHEHSHRDHRLHIGVLSVAAEHNFVRQTTVAVVFNDGEVDDRPPRLLRAHEMQSASADNCERKHRGQFVRRAPTTERTYRSDATECPESSYMMHVTDQNLHKQFLLVYALCGYHSGAVSEDPKAEGRAEIGRD